MCKTNCPPPFPGLGLAQLYPVGISCGGVTVFVFVFFFVFCFFVFFLLMTLILSTTTTTYETHELEKKA